MENFLENTSDSVWVIDNNYKLLYFNNSFKVDFKNTMGARIKIGEDIGKNLSSEMVAFWKTQYDKALNGSRFSFEQSFTDKNNQQKHIQVSLSPLIKNDKITGVTCLGRDVTNEKENERLLKQYGFFLNSCLESQIDTVILAIDNEFNYLYFNQAHQKLMEDIYNSEVKTGMNILDCITNKKDRELAFNNYSKALRGESHSNIDSYGAEDKIYFESHFNPIKNNDHEIVGATALARIITARVQMENELKEANAAKNKFFSIISHDLKSPISSVLSLIQYIDANFHDYSKEQLKPFIEGAAQSLTTSYSLLEDLLLWSRVQKKSITFSPEKVNISHVTEKILSIYADRIKDKNISVKKSFPLVLHVVVDRHLISTVLRNLISNAIKFSNRDGLIDIVLKKVIKYNEHNLELIVSDHGIGIPKENISKLFNIGENISTLGTSEEKGTGLGLVICKELIDIHGGKISISSEVNQGTKVSVFLPQ